MLSTRSLSCFVRMTSLLRRLRSARFLRTRREWVLSREHRRCNEANQYHPAQQSPHENNWLPGNENSHRRTSGDEERRTKYHYYTAEKPHPSMNTALKNKLGGGIVGRLGLQHL